MEPNPYQSPPIAKDAYRLPWAKPAKPWLIPLVGLVTGLATGPICWVVLMVSMHEEHDPPLAQQFFRAWYGAVPITLFAGFFGAWLGFVWTIIAKRQPT